MTSNQVASKTLLLNVGALFSPQLSSLRFPFEYESNVRLALLVYIKWRQVKQL